MTHMSIRCGSKLVCHNAFEYLFMEATRSSIQRRKLTSFAMEHVKNSASTRTEAKTPLAITAEAIAAKRAKGREMNEYNQRLKAYALKFKKRDESQVQASAIVEEMIRKGLQPSNQTYLQLLMGISLQRHRTHKQNSRMEAWFEEFLKLELLKRNPWPKLKKAILAMSFKGHPNMKAMFLKLDSAHRVQDSECWNAAITGCVRDRQLQDAEALLMMAQKRRLTNSKSYQTLIDVYLFLQDQPSASRIFSLMIDHNVAANFPIFESFIAYYISQPASNDSIKTMERLWQALLVTSTENIPDETIFKLLRYYRMHRSFASGEQVYLDLKSRQQKLNERCADELYKVIVGFSNQRKLLSALSLTYDLLGQGYSPSYEVLCKIIEGCIKMKDKDAAYQIMNIIQEINPQARLLTGKCFSALNDTKRE
ncbi:hypothetical protein [Parasitella parasitica]|uniref:Pentacotripeptide-repeat region of PRORP domain-containing protein n=1 Tax=Parasitella parasitica TaxID=35722 RepID=A0A0B7NND6_9FUNG|nr:hypothetical protein [Parasitella parasitica]